MSARPTLTPRERVVLLAVGQRLTNGEIADWLKVSKRTVESHIASLFAKFGVEKRLDLVALAVTDVEEEPPAGLVGTSALMWRELTRLRTQLAVFTAAAHAQRSLDQAYGVLFERYRLPSIEAAALMLSGVALQRGLPEADLARALLTAPSMEDADRWLRHRGQDPELPFAHGTDLAVPQVLDAALRASTACADAEQGDLQLISSGGSGLDIVASQCFTAAFVSRFAHVEGKGTACALALDTGEPVSIPDITRSEVYEPTARAALDAERVRAVHSIPMLTSQGDCVGVVSTHRPRPGRVPGRAAQHELDRIAEQTAAWLAWQRRTVRLDALRDLHERASRSGR